MAFKEYTGEVIPAENQGVPSLKPYDGKVILDVQDTPEGGFVASAKQSIGSAINGAGQAAADFIPGVGQDNAVKRYGQEVIDANPTAVKSLGDIADNPGTAVKEAVGNAAGSMGPMIGARLLGQGITAAAPLTGPFAPVTAAVGQGVAWLGPAAAAALPSFGGIREQQIKDDPSKADDLGAKARAATGAAAVGAIESKFGPQEWALGALSKEGRAKLAEKFAAKTLGGSVAKGAATGAAVEGAEELVQNPIEQIAAYQDPTTAENVQDTLFGGAMGAIGGGVLGGGFGGVSRAMGSDEKAPGAAPAEAGGEEPAAPPLALPSPTYTGTPTDQILQAEAERQNQVDEAQARARDLYQRRDAFDAARTPPEQEGPDLSPVRESNAARLDALGQQEAGEPDVPQTAPPDGGAILKARRNAEIAAGRAMASPDDEILQSIGAAEPPHQAMGIDPEAGPLSAGAAIAVDSGVHGQMQAAAQVAQVQTAGGGAGGAGGAAPGIADRSQPAQEGSPAARWDSLTAQERTEVAARAGLPPVIARNIPRAGWESLNGDLQARISTAMAPVAKPATSAGSGANLGDGWTAFPPESGTLAVPRAQMPQIKAEHRGAMTNFMNARGVSHTTEEVPANSLRPTQAEFSPEKVKKAAGFEGGDRSILVSSDNYVLDGHHQWLAKREADAPVKVIRLNAPIQQLIGLAHEFPSSTTAGGASAPNGGLGDRGRAAAVADDLRAMAQDAGWAERGGLLIRDSAGNATGRTKWLPRAEWFMAGMEADPATLARDIDRFVGGEKVPAKSRRTIEGMLDWLDAQRGESRLNEDASAYDFEAAGLGQDASEEAMLIGDIFAEAAPQEDAAVMRALGFTEQEIQDVVGPQEDRAGQGSARQPDAGRAQEAGEVARGDAQAQGEARSEGSPEGLTDGRGERVTAEVAGTLGRGDILRDESGAEYYVWSARFGGAGSIEVVPFKDGKPVVYAGSSIRFALTPAAQEANPERRSDALFLVKRAAIEPALASYTNEDIARQEATQRAAAAEAERTQREADQKAQADAERDTFTLTGSDRTADVLAAQGQGGLFDAPVVAPAKSPRPESDNDGLPKKRTPAQQLSKALEIASKNRNILDGLHSMSNGIDSDEALIGVVLDAAKGLSAEYQRKARSAVNRGTRKAADGRVARNIDRFIEEVGEVFSSVNYLLRDALAQAVNQEPIKNETRADAGPDAAAAPADQETVKNLADDSPAVGNAPSPLEALFSDLNSDSTRKANKAKKAAAKLPQAARIDYVQANFHDLLIQMMEAGALEVNGATTLTEDNAPCL